MCSFPFHRISLPYLWIFFTFIALATWYACVCVFGCVCVHRHETWELWLLATEYGWCFYSALWKNHKNGNKCVLCSRKKGIISTRFRASLFILVSCSFFSTFCLRACVCVWASLCIVPCHVIITMTLCDDISIAWYQQLVRYDLNWLCLSLIRKFILYTEILTKYDIPSSFSTQKRSFRIFATNGLPIK